MEVLAWVVGIATILLALVALLRSLSPTPDKDTEATFARIDERRAATEVAAEEAAQRATAKVKREFP